MDKKALIVSLSILLILNSIFISVNAGPTSNVQDYFKSLDKTNNPCLTNCYHEFLFCNPDNESIDLYSIEKWYIKENLQANDLISLYLSYQYNKSTNITDYVNEYYLKNETINCTGDEYRDEYGNLPKEIQKLCDESKTGSIIYEFNQSRKKVVGSHLEYSILWLPISSSKIKSLKPNECIKLKISGNRQAKLGNNAVDWKLRYTDDLNNKFEPKWAWWNSSWSKCMNVTITNPTASTLTDFPVFINLSWDDDMNADWSDIRFVNESCNNGGLELSHEYVTNDSNSAEFHVKVPSLASGSNVISVYYGNAGASDASTSDTWSNHFIYVEHFTKYNSTTYQDSASGVFGNITGNPSETSGMMGDALVCDGSDDMVDYGDNFDILTPETTIDAFYNVSSTASRRWISKYQDNSNRYYAGQWTGTNIITYALDSTHTVWGFITGNIISAGNWDTFSTVINQTIDDTGNIYYKAVDYPLATETSTQEQIENTGPFRICDYAGTKSQVWADEVRISNTTRSQDWVNATYQFYINQGTYVTFGSEESGAPSDNPPTTILDLPADNFVNDTTESVFINFTINATDDNNLFNCSLWHNATGTWHRNGTNSVTGTDNQTSFGLTLKNVSFIWNAYCCDNASQCDWGNANRTIYVNWTDPDIPQFSNFVSYPANGSVYSYGTNYQFNATVTSTNGSVEIEFNNTHYTATNLTADGYNASIGDQGAGVYMYYWLGYGNGSWHQYNFSAQFHYTILQAVPTGILNNNTVLTRTYDGSATTINYTETQNGDGDLTYIIWKNGANVGTTDTEAGAGVYTYVLNTTGGHNYTANASMDSLVLNITQATPSINLTLNGTQSNTSVVQGSSIYLNCSTINGDSGAYLVLYRNGTLINNGTSPIYNSTTFNTAGIENITCVYENTQNYSTSYETWWINVTPSADTEYPQFTTPQEYPTDPATYVYGQSYLFNITITSTNGTAGIEFNHINYSVDNTSSLFNATITDLPVGDYSYFWWAFGNGTSHNFNISSTYYYNITKANPIGNLTNNTVLERVYDGTPTLIGYSEANNGDGDLTYVIWKNGANVGIVDSEAGVGEYTYILNTTGGINYTANASMDTLTLNITQATATCSLIFDQVSPITYGTQLNASCSCTSEASATLYRNGTDVTATENNVLVTLGVANWSYICNVSSSQNYTSASNISSFVINQASGNLSLLLNGAENNLTVTYPQQTNITATTLYGSVEIYRDGTNITDENGLNVTRGVGYYNITAYSSGDTNHSATNTTYWLNVSIGTGEVYLYLNNSRANTTINNATNIYINGSINTGDSGNVLLYWNGTLINNGTSPIYNYTNFSVPGIYNVTALYMGSTNYTSDYETWWLNITEYVPPTTYCNGNYSTGNWIVNYTLKCEDEVIYLNGDLNITTNGNLTFDNITLLVNATSDGQYEAISESGGIFSIYNSIYNTTNSNYECRLRFLNPSRITIVNSTFEEFSFSGAGGSTLIYSNNTYIKNSVFSKGHRGLYILGGNDTYIENTNFTDLTDYAIYGYNKIHNFTIKDSLINNSQGGIYTTAYSENIYILNNTINNSGYGGGFCLILENNNYSYVYNNWIGNGEQVTVRGSHSIIENNTMYNLTGDLFACGNSNTNVSAIGNNLSFFTDYGIYSDTCTNLLVERNLIYNTTLHGIYFSNVDNSMINDNTIYNCLLNGIYVTTTSTGGNITNNNISRIYGTHGIYGRNVINNTINATNAQYGIYSRVKILDNTVIGGTDSGIYVDDDTYPNRIGGNNVTQANYALRLNGFDNNIVQNNSFSYNTYGVYLQDSSDSIFSNNTWFNNTNLGVIHTNGNNNSFDNNSWEGINHYDNRRINVSGTNFKIINWTTPPSDSISNITGIAWNITNTSATSTMSLSIYYLDPADLTGLNETRFKVFRYNGSQWFNLSTGNVDTTNDFAWENLISVIANRLYAVGERVDYPHFSNYHVNESLAGNGSWVRFNLTVSDSDYVSFVNGTINNTQFIFSNLSATHWYYDFQCNETGVIVWSHISANDTYNKWNDTAITGYNFTCDADFPQFSGQSANETNITQNDYFCINITITDTTSSIDTVYAEVNNSVNLVNYTMTNTTSNCGGGGNVYEVSIQATSGGIWNYSRVWANDTANNANYTDFTDISINVTPSAPAPSAEPEIFTTRTKYYVIYNMSINTSDNRVTNDENLTVNISIFTEDETRYYTYIDMTYSIVDEFGFVIASKSNEVAVKQENNFTIEMNLKNTTRGYYKFIARGEYNLFNVVEEDLDIRVFNNYIELFVNRYYLQLSIVILILCIFGSVFAYDYYRFKSDMRNEEIITSRAKIHYLTSRLKLLEGKFNKFSSDIVIKVNRKEDRKEEVTKNEKK